MKSEIDKVEPACRAFKAYFNLSKFMGYDPVESAMAANRAVRKLCGMDILKNLHIEF